MAGWGIWALPTGVLAGALLFLQPDSPGPHLLYLLVGIYTLLFYRTPATFQRASVGEMAPGPLSESLQALAAEQGLAPLVLKTIQTGASLGAHAFAVNLARPTVAVAHGLVQRLSPAQQLAIGAHEIAHIRSGSLWWLMGGFPVGLALGFVALFFAPMDTALGLALCLGIFLPRIWLSRPTEVLCDRMAAEWTSAETLREALERLHAVHPVDLNSRWGKLAYALATHPPLPVRLAALGDPNADGAAHQRAAVLAQTLLVLTLATAVALQAPFAVFLVLVLVPTFVLSRGARVALKRRQTRMPGQRRWWMVAVIPLVVLLFASLDPELEAQRGWVLLGMLALEVVLIPLLWRHYKGKRLVKQLQTRLAAGDLEGVWAYRSTHAKALYRSPALNHDVLAVGTLLEKFGAAKELLELVPSFPQAGLTLADLTVYRDPEMSLKAARAFQAALPQDPGGPVAVGRALLAQGDLVGAEQALEGVRALEGKAAAEILAAELALAHQRFQVCHSHLDQAELHAPGDPWLMLVRADLALSLDELDRAQSAMEHVAGTLDAMPVQGMGVRLSALRARLSAIQAETDGPVAG